MNVDNTSNSKQINSCEVTSKYFAGNGSMDESLSEFQEKKHYTNTKKNTTATKPKPKKKTKKLQGQKDIRTALKSKKNELVAYSNDFDKICRQSGIDIDSEQLQLAIALSKSLQQTETPTEESSSISKALTSQERTEKIRTTLQEYGFVVPEIKITATKGRKSKKYRKNYKLLLASESEKQQIISHRYSHVLFESLNKTEAVNSSTNLSKHCGGLYYKGTNISYKELKDVTTLYVEDLLEKLPSSVGCLLKDWTIIPGRPTSPTIESSPVKFERIDCTEEELDFVLSGQLKSVQEIVKEKYNLLPLEEIVDSHKSIEDCVEKETEKVLKMETDCIEIYDDTESDTVGSITKRNASIRIIDVDSADLLAITQNARSCSPDIFDDEVSEIIDSPKKGLNSISQSQLCKNATNTCHSTMDLTECVINVNSNSQRAIINHTTLSQGNNITRRNSNDLMEITRCVVGSSQPIRENIIQENIIEENIDLTQNLEDGDHVLNSNKIANNKEIEPIMDLTQSSDTNEELPIVQISGKNTMDDTIDVNVDANPENHNNSVGHDLLQGKISKENMSRNLDTNTTQLESFKAQNIINIEDDMGHCINKNLNERAISPIECVMSDDNFIALDQIKPMQSLKHQENVEKAVKSKTSSFFEEFSHRHSESSEGDASDVVVRNGSNKDISNENNINENNSDKIDLTQKTDSSEETINYTEEQNSPKIPIDSGGLGKIGDVSIDYDELFDNMVKSHTSSITQSRSISSSLKTDVCAKDIDNPSNSDLVLNSSQNSDAFEISDKELDYSLHQSRLDFNPPPNYDFGEISIVDAIPDLPSFRPSTSFIGRNTLNKSLSDSFLPMVNIKGTNKDTNDETKSCSSTPNREPGKGIIAKTPKNGEYIIKTDTVTPMLDYERMTTPERNAELDKYGLKPFKRKRAIQLLTHLYNQTHPIVESLEALPSPPKRYKPTNTNASPTKNTSPKKKSEDLKAITQKNVCKSPRKLDDVENDLEELDKENDIYDVTNDIPIIRDMECCEEDLVFQKREKAKLHSCRVPLHIAFHNYLSTRRRLLESVLRYEPVNIDLIHKGLVDNGFRYDPKDLLKFMDKKCITVKTADSNTKNKKHY